MTLWLLFALMTALAVLAVVWPLARARAARPAGSDVAVYRDQLLEIDRDQAAGSLAAAEAAAARVEVSRRLLAAADAQECASRTAAPGSLLRRRRIVAVGALGVLPIAVLGLYLSLGSPSLPGEPLAARSPDPHVNQTMAALLAQVEDRLAHHPQDGRGWELIAPVYLRLGRFDAAAMAWRKAIALNGESAERLANLGEALTAAENGIVTDDARRAFARAVALDAGEPKARYYVGLVAEQDGKPEEAARIWRAMLAGAPPEAAWAPFVRAALAQIEGQAVPVAAAIAGVPAAQAGDDLAASASGPSAADAADANAMDSDRRNALIRTMVERLSTRLKENGADEAGWLRLVRSYVVLGEPEKARAAAADARRALQGDQGRVHRVDDLVRQLGIEG